jgi:DNA-binding transcriptional LysR family regulator
VLSEVTAVPFARAPLYAALSESHPAAAREHLRLRDLAADQWILFARQVHPVIYEAVVNAAQMEGIAPKAAHDIFTAQQAVYLVSQHAGIAIFAEPPSLPRHEGVVIKPLTDKSLCFETCLILRADQDQKVRAATRRPKADGFAATRLISSGLASTIPLQSLAPRIGCGAR